LTLLLPAPDRLIDLSGKEYRRTHPSRWRLFVACLRHPILAFAAWRQQEHPPAFSERTRTLFWVALIHGVVAAFLT
jgi:hypothetical protein